MMKLLMGLMLLVTAASASAEWTAVGANDNFVQYADRATIRRNGNFVKMWGLEDYKLVSALSHRYQNEYDCKEEKFRILEISFLSGRMGSGTVTTTDSDTGKWTAVVPGSMAEVLWKIACGKE